ncbi:RlpA-like double-psi beta-barrel-containing domain containing protein [Tylopilus felleus]
MYIFATLSVLLVPVMSMPVNEAAIKKRTSYNGIGTYFDVGLGACGFNNVNTDLIVALPVSQYGTGQHCNQYVWIEDTQTKKTAYAQVRDKCPGCQEGHLDMSPTLFENLGAPLGQGVIDITWHFMHPGWHP